MIFSADELWMLATCATCAAACALPGTFLFLRRESLTGDAISHAILPGLAAAFLVSQTRSLTWMLLGAGCAGFTAMGLWSMVQRTQKVKSDVALGMIYTSFFALGVILISIAARNVDLDPGCVLYGSVEFAPLDTVSVKGFEVPRSFLVLVAVLLFNVTLVALALKELVLSTFDPALARSMGFNTTAIRCALIATTTLTIVASFEAVGSILVVTMLAAPPATASLLTKRVTPLLFAAIMLGGCASLLGVWGAVELNTSVAGMTSVAAGGLFCGALLFAPSNGIVARALTQLQMQIQIAQDDILGALYRWYEVPEDERQSAFLTRSSLLKALQRGLRGRLALRRAVRKGYLAHERATDAVRLTESGLVEARALVRSHRLWESYLAKHLGLPPDHLHDLSERTEHFIGRAITRELQRDLASTEDPHGREIP